MNQRIACYTLFDITHTNVLNRSKPNIDDPEEWIKQRNSQANLDTILQCLGLRSQPELVIYPQIIDHSDEPAEVVFLYDDVTYWSWKFNDISQGQDATPLWIPQSSMVLGSVIFAIALSDHLVHVLVSGDHRIVSDVLEQSHGE